MIQVPEKQKLVLSYSKISTYKCPKKYHYQYVQKMPKTDNARNSLPGRAIQKLFELFVNSKQFPNGSVWLYENVQKIFFNEYKRYESTTVFYRNEDYYGVLNEVIDMIPTCYDLFVKKRWNEGTIFSEVRFQAELSGTIRLIGDIDFLIKTKTETVIMDFKSTSKGLAGIDKEQLLIYNYLYKANHGHLPTNTYFFLCRDNQLVRVNVTQKDMDDLASRLIKTGTDIQNGNWQKNPSESNCKYCPYKKSCWAPGKPPF